MTEQQLRAFIDLRNKNPFGINRQFVADAEACGFQFSELGEIIRLDSSFQWRTRYGLLIERNGFLTLQKF